MNHDTPIQLRSVFGFFLVLATASLASHQSGLDIYLARTIFNIEGASTGFAWKNNYWLSDIIHEEGRSLAKRLFFLNLFLLIASRFVDRLRPWGMAFAYILLSTLLSTGLIGVFKSLTTLPCPQSLAEFGGSREWVNIWRIIDPSLPRGHCYPAGHSSAGYAWLCLGFVSPFASRRFYLCLLPGILLGLVFGVTQQLRGAHFLSHDLLTAGISWLVAGATAYGLQKLTTAKQSPRKRLQTGKRRPWHKGEVMNTGSAVQVERT